MFTRLAVVGVSTFSSQLLFFDIVVAFAPKTKEERTRRANSKKKKEKICDESFSLSLSQARSLSKRCARSRLRALRNRKTGKAHERGTSIWFFSLPKAGPSGAPQKREDFESLFEQKFEEKNTETTYRRRRRKDAHNRGEKPRRFSCATRERREPLLLLVVLLVVVVQTFRRVRLTLSLLKTCTNERKIQSFFVIFKFIKIQKRKKKRRGKKE